MAAVEGPAAPSFLTPLRVTESEFRAFQRLVYAEAGIHLHDGKKALLAGRLSRRLRVLGLHTLAEYFQHLRHHPEEQVAMLDCITTNETRFFREPRQFELLEQRVLPGWRKAAAAGRRSRHVRVWSAGCSTGEEPYSLAMLLLSGLPAEEGWNVEIVATDLSTRVLARAREGVWALGRAQDVPLHLRRAFLLRGVGSREGWMKAGDEIRRVVHFERLNLMTEAYPKGPAFDLVFCRNVLIYFDAASKAHVLRGLMERLSPEGLLFLGHAESLGRTEPPMRPVCPNVYAFAETAQ
jgi:chemotaxis protein methyltransferase CheR